LVDAHRSVNINSLEGLVWVAGAVGERLPLRLLETRVFMGVGMRMGMGGGNSRYKERE
jgi:hypothetical protein